MCFSLAEDILLPNHNNLLANLKFIIVFVLVDLYLIDNNFIVSARLGSFKINNYSAFPDTHKTSLTSENVSDINKSD